MNCSAFMNLGPAASTLVKLVVCQKIQLWDISITLIGHTAKSRRRFKLTFKLIGVGAIGP
jgi:hypothetical protein